MRGAGKGRKIGRRWLVCGWLAALGLLLTACGGPGRGTPTAVPADVVRPQQAGPVYPQRADLFNANTPKGTPVFVPTATPTAASESAPSAAAFARSAMNLLVIQQTPSATGIAPAGATIYVRPSGPALANVPVAGTVTVVGKSADGRFYAVYDDNAVAGWTPVGQLTVFGGDDLAVVDKAPDPGPVATLLAQAMRPVNVLDSLMITLTATPRAPAAAAIIPPTAIPTAAAQPAPPVQPLLPPTTPTQEVAAATAGILGSVSSDGRLNLRAAPDAGSPIMAKLQPNTQVRVIGRTAAGDWLQVQAGANSGWLAAEFVQLGGSLENLPVAAP